MSEAKKGQGGKNSGLKKLPKFESVGYPRPLYGDVEGVLYDIPGYRGLGRKGLKSTPLEAQELVPVPKESSLYSLPERKPVLWKKGELEVLPHPLTAVGAVLPENYISLALPAFEGDEETKESLPPLAYAALACWQNQNWVAAARITGHGVKGLPQVVMVSSDEKIQRLSGLGKPEIPTEEWELVVAFGLGVSDLPSEILKWQEFLRENQPTAISLKSLACDWEVFFAGLEATEESPMGLKSLLESLKKVAPNAAIDRVEPYWKE